MTQPPDNEWSSYSIFRVIGYGLLALALFDLIHLLIPLNFLNPTWEFQTIGGLVERVAVPLLGLGLVFYGEGDYRSKWEKFILKILSWFSLVSGILFLLLTPLLLVNSIRISNQINNQINAQGSQKLEQFEQVETQLSQATTDKDINSVITRFKIEGLPPNIKNPQELKTQTLAEIAKAKKTLKSQTDALEADKQLELFKNCLKWSLGALVSGLLFIYIWKLSRWARRGKKYSEW
jgi:hypothetical protein